MKELISSAVNTHPSPTLPSYFNSVHRSHIYVMYTKNHSTSDYADHCTCLSETRVLEGWHNTNTAPAPHGWQGLKRPNRARGGSELLAPLTTTAELSSIFTFFGFQASGCTVYTVQCTAQNVQSMERSGFKSNQRHNINSSRQNPFLPELLST